MGEENPDFKQFVDFINSYNDVDLKVLAKRTPGFTGADLQNLLNESALLAARKNKDKISMEDVDVSIDRVIAGVEKKSRVLTDKDKELTSYHEVGHALIDKLLPDDPFSRAEKLIIKLSSKYCFNSSVVNLSG